MPRGRRAWEPAVSSLSAEASHSDGCGEAGRLSAQRPYTAPEPVSRGGSVAGGRGWRWWGLPAPTPPPSVDPAVQSPTIRPSIHPDACPFIRPHTLGSSPWPPEYLVSGAAFAARTASVTTNGTSGGDGVKAETCWLRPRSAEQGLWCRVPAPTAALFTAARGGRNPSVCQ